MTAAHQDALKRSAAGIVDRIADIELERKHVALEAFAALERYDRDTATLAMAVFEDREDAALWFTRVLPFSDCTPWHLLAAGESEKVREILKTVGDSMSFFE